MQLPMKLRCKLVHHGYMVYTEMETVSLGTSLVLLLLLLLLLLLQLLLNNNNNNNNNNKERFSNQS